VNDVSDEGLRPLSGAEMANAMGQLADGFIRGSEADRLPPFVWDSSDVARLDEICDDLRTRNNPTGDGWHSRIMTMGAYLGELLVLHGHGHWSYNAEERAAVVVMPNGLAAFPHNKVAKRLEFGPKHNLVAFFEYALAGRDCGDGARRCSGHVKVADQVIRLQHPLVA
jgi:hypothetical protein